MVRSDQSPVVRRLEQRVSYVVSALWSLDVLFDRSGKRITRARSHLGTVVDDRLCFGKGRREDAAGETDVLYT
jgi:hypothetical protein